MRNKLTQENSTAKAVILAGLKKILFPKKETSFVDFIKENNLYFNTKVLEQPVFKNSLKVFKLYDPQKNTSIRNFFIFNEPNYEEFENNAFQYSYGLLKKLPDGYSINFDFVNIKTFFFHRFN